MVRALTFTHVFVDISQPVLEHQRPFQTDPSIHFYADSNQTVLEHAHYSEPYHGYRSSYTTDYIGDLTDLSLFIPGLFLSTIIFTLVCAQSCLRLSISNLAYYIVMKMW